MQKAGSFFTGGGFKESLDLSTGELRKMIQEEFADLASSLLTAAAVGANPFLFVASLISLGASYTKDKKHHFFKRNYKGF